MMSTGIIRRMDDLGKIMIPKEIRENLGIEEGTPMEIMVNDEDDIVLKRYVEDQGVTLEEAVKKIQETLDSPELKSEIPEDILNNMKDYMKDYWDMIRIHFQIVKE